MFVRSLLALLIAITVVLGAAQEADAAPNMKGQWYVIDNTFRGVQTQARIDYYSVNSAGNGYVSGYIAILYGRSSDGCFRAQFKATPGAWWHHSTPQVCSYTGRWVVYQWSDNFTFWNGGSYSFRTCHVEWNRDTCSRARYIDVE